MSLVGRVFSNRYEIQRELAQGGMAEVYLALDQLLNRPVALKALFPEYAREPSFVERFRREAQAAANLNHPNIVAIYDWGQEEGTYFIVMEYVEGRSLRELIRGEGPLDAHQAAEITAEIASALAFAHRSGLVHRDVKPGNVLMTPTGTVKVTDFGIARAGTSDGLTQTGSVMGTATYFSPEQAQGLAVDGRSDVYSLGIVLYEMVTGVVPFTGDSPVAVAYKHVREDVVPPGRRNPEVPADLENIVMTALAKDPDHRYQTADDMRADLLRFRRGRPLAAAPVTAIVAEVPTGAVAAGGGVVAAATTVSPRVAIQDRSHWSAQTYDAPRRNGGLITAVVLVALAALVGGILVAANAFGGGDKVSVQSVVGKNVDDATSILEEQGFSVNPEQIPNDNEALGIVFDQSPNGGDEAEKGSTVTLSVSAGAGTKELPDFTDTLAEDAKKTLESSGFNVTLVPESHDTIRLGRVIRTEPAGGERAPVGSNVTVVLSSGPPQVKIPDVANQPRQQALETLSKDFSVQTVLEPSDTVEADRVTRTEPAAGTDLQKTSAIKMFVSTGKDQTVVPEVRGLGIDDAKTKLSAARLQASTIEQTSTPGNEGKVIDQTPPAGTRTDPNATVVLTVGAAAPTTTTVAPATSTTSTTPPTTVAP